MTSDLFPDCRQDSPRLAWMRRHGITVRPASMYARVCILEESGPEAEKDFRFVASAPTLPEGSVSSYGSTEDDALAGVAKALGIPLWNEEANKQP